MADTAQPPTIAEANIILIGYRGCGKSTVGRVLAARLGWTFHDTDEHVQQSTGKTIHEIFDAEGEPAFRKLEAQALDAALRNTQTVISAGGGAVLARRNRRFMRAGGTCVWLTASPEEILRRLQADEKTAEQRPALTDAEDPMAEIEELMQTRLPVYEATADHVINTTGRTVDEVVEAVLQRLAATVHVTER